MKNLHLLLLLLIFFGCRSFEAVTYDFPTPVDTTTKPIELQIKKVYHPDNQGVFADNQFDGARLNDFQYKGDSSFVATISPENQPINNSAYYGFKLWANNSRTIDLELNYIGGKHRYFPKLSSDGVHWTEIDSSQFRFDTDSINAFINLELSPDTLWVCAQELQTSSHVINWCKELAEHQDARYEIAGTSEKGRAIPMLEISTSPIQKKEVIVLLSRQHPPEVTGYLAMKAFTEAILADTPLSNEFRKKYRIVAFPLMNPDGVDLGHWRHNAGGIDLNRDWAYYHQAETRTVANKIAETVAKNKNKVILGFDFHSTWYDIFYTNKQPTKNLPAFKDYWIAGIKSALDAPDIIERPSNVGKPVSKNWFLTQFDAEGITYEIGDDTPRDLIKKKGEVSAIEMMQLLIYKSNSK